MFSSLTPSKKSFPPFWTMLEMTFLSSEGCFNAQWGIEMSLRKRSMPNDIQGESQNHHCRSNDILKTRKKLTIFTFFGTRIPKLRNPNTVLYCALKKNFQIFSTFFLPLKIVFVYFQLFLYCKLVIVEKNLKEFSRVKKQLKIFETIFLEHNTKFRKIFGSS